MHDGRIDRRIDRLRRIRRATRTSQAFGACVLWAGFAVGAAVARVAVPVAPPTAAAQPDREVQLAADAFRKGVETPRWVEPHAVPGARAGGPAVIELSDTQVMVTDRPITYIHRAIRINDATALPSIGRVPLVFIPDYQRIDLHTLQVLRDGAVLDRLATAQVRFLQRETGLESNLYSGIVTASILIDDLRVGDTLELAYSLIGANPVFGDRFGGAESWDQPLPTEYRRIVVNAPLARRVGWRFHGGARVADRRYPAPTETVANGIRTVRFEQQSLAAVAPEPSVPAGFSLYRWLQLSEYNDWQDVATWAAALFDVHEAPSPERRALVATLMARPTVEERVVGALEFVQSEVRYFSVSLGTSSHRPTPPDTVLARRYGDCKDKSLLLVALLDDMGIASTPLLAKLGNRIGFDDWLPTPLAFDHVIVAVDVDGVRYDLDPTRLGQHGRLARMGQVHDGAQVLPASTTDGKLRRVTVANRDALTRDDRSESLVLDKLDGDGVLTVVQTAVGVAAEIVRVGIGALPKDRLDALMNGDIDKRYTGATLLEPTRIDDDRDDNRITLTSRFTLPKPAERSGDGWRVGFRPDNFQRLFALPQEQKRIAPVGLRHPLTVAYRFDVVFPEDVAVGGEDEVVPVADRYFQSSANRSFRGNRSTVSIELKTLGDRIAADDLPTVRDDVRRFQKSFPGFVVVRDADVKQSVFLGLGKKDLAATLGARQQDFIAKVSATIASGRLNGGDLARAYCDRARAYASSGRRDDASHDADEAVAIDPNSASSLVCRADVRNRLGDFEPAIDDASRAIVVGADSGAAWQVRGEARFHLGRYADAVADFAEAGTLDRDERATLRHDLWRAMAYRRMKQPLPEDLRTRAEAKPDGEWPRPALALFADRIAPDEMSRRAVRNGGDDAILNGVEADFYLGEYYLSVDDDVNARAAFDSARAKGIASIPASGAAGLELDRLDRRR